jgi:glycosyltransferase involved in cell wall biosynthesis
MPSEKQVYRLARNSDVVLQNNISLRTLFPSIASRKPVVITHQTWITRTTGRLGWQDYVKRAVLPLCQNIAISEAVAATLPVEAEVIGNPFEPGEFSNLGDDYRSKDIVFMGRLVSEKGCDLVLRALVELKRQDLCPSFTIIGDGPEMPALQHLAKELALESQVSFAGALREGRGREVARHRVMVIPSTWEEPFGVVALEGIAAGCAIAASRSGGLPEAVGRCGVIFPIGDIDALASLLNTLLTNSSLRRELTRNAHDHLERFRPEMIAVRYLNIFEAAIRRKKT